jgi:hypothetical protein
MNEILFGSILEGLLLVGNNSILEETNRLVPATNLHPSSTLYPHN